MKKIAIKCKSPEHGKQIIQYLESIGGVNKFDLNNKLLNYYYYIDKNGNINYSSILYHAYTETELPTEIPELPLGVLMEVSDYEDFPKEETVQRYVFGKKNGNHKYVAWDTSKQNIFFWKYARPIQREKEIHLTMEDISNGKGVGVPAHLIRIKKIKK